MTATLYSSEANEVDIDRISFLLYNATVVAYRSDGIEDEESSTDG